MSISKRKLEANRRNAQRSTGARTEAGKAAVSQNRTTHGLCGRFRVLPFEKQEEYDEFLAQFMEDEKPIGLAEIDLVRKMAQHTWLANRALHIQERMFVVDEQTPEQKCSGDFTVRVRGDLDVYLRYHTAHDRAYQRAFNQLIRHRNERLKGERGFESQKRAEAEEARKAELHPHKVRTAAAHADCAQSNAAIQASKAADTLLKGLPPEALAEIAAQPPQHLAAMLGPGLKAA